MTTFIQLVALAISITFIILVVKWQVDDDIKKMQKRLDKVHKEINNKKKTMSKDITKDILLKAGFKEIEISKINPKYITFELTNLTNWDISITNYPFLSNQPRKWSCEVNNNINRYAAEADIQTIDHFNKLMNIMDINFRLKEE